jgi:8-oxo-dGTP diphosphatase
MHHATGGIMGREDQGVAVSCHRYQAIPRTLCFITHGEEVLLLLGGPKKRLWAGRYNGLGGHVEPGEDIYSSASREVREEAGLNVRDMRLRGVVHVDANEPAAGILFFVFTAVADEKRVVASEEGALEWWPAAALPIDSLVEDLPVLLPKILAMGPTDPPLFVAYSYDNDDRLVIQFAEQV